MRKIYIVGAHSRAQTLAVYLRYLYPDISIEAYLVNNDEKNAVSIENTPVVDLNQHTKLHTEYPVYIGTRGVYHEKLISELRQYGFTDILPVTVELDLELRNAYLEKYFTSIGRTFIKLDKLSPCSINSGRRKGTVYVARNIHDRELERPWNLKSYEKEIQAGTALADRFISEEVIADDTGNNISSKNKQFCELTVLYWIWKNAEDDVAGLEHYRRHFILPDDWLERMEAYGIDVILPVPLYVAPSLEENYKFRHDPSDWEYMMEYLRSRDEELFYGAEQFFQGNLYSPCNMFIMRKSALNDLCEWLFPILDEVVRHGGQKEDPYWNRYPGFLSERLITFFFERYQDKYKLVYADKNFLR